MKRLNLPSERTFIGPALIWKRIAAFFIDLLMLNIVVLLPVRKILQSIIPENYSFSEAYKLLSSTTSTGYITSVSIVMSIFAILYFYLLEKNMKQTIGKMLMKIYVVADDNARAWQFLARNLVFIPVFPFILLLILDPLFMFFTKTNQRLSEILSKTRVVEMYSL